MQTYTHLLVGYVLSRQVAAQQDPQGVDPTLYADSPASNAAIVDTSSLPAINTRATLLGSIAPDLPLILLTVYFIIVDLLAGNSLDPSSAPEQSNVGILFDDLFFNDPGVIFLHNLFHAPILTVTYMLVGYMAWRAGRKWGPALFWFGVACTLHTLIDIPTHYNDGPLIFFPFDWETRFYSPISYWDPSRGGIWFAVFEHVFVLLLLLYVVRDWFRRRRQAVEAEG